jgi:hypothetical protein
MKKRETFNKLYNNGISYQEYLDRSEKYTKRMNQSYSISEKVVNKDLQEQIVKLNEKMHILCIAEEWCIDCANSVPIIAMLAERISKWQLRITSRDRFPADFDHFYKTAGRKKIPVMIFADEDGDEIIRWIERPFRSYQILGALKKQNLTKEEFSQKYQDTLELHPPIVSHNILCELVSIAEKASSIIHVNPPEKKPVIPNKLK